MGDLPFVVHDERYERCGFRVVGRREKLGALGGVWRDVLLLERRSSVVRNG
ncbi:MAG TPA: hypothetical protein VHV78_06770 [Gemmatimonadaceae bacterium]|nr:hypothetical protein [Gemmatimonadaceae bacterium]